MKLSTITQVAAVLITGSFAVPTPIPTSIHVPVSQDPSPPRPFPAGHIVEVNDPSPPRPFPKYALEGATPLEERDPLALSHFPTDGEDEAHDPSPPRPFPAGHIVEVKDPSPPRPFPKYPLEERDPLALSRFPTDGEDEARDPSPPRPFPAGHIVEVKNPSPPLEERDPSAPHKLVESYTIATDPSPPRPFPKYALDGGNPLEERDPLSRFPTNGEKEAVDPSPPSPFPAGRVVDAEDPSSPSITIEPRSPSPLLRTPEGAEAEANDPSPPRPFPASHPVDVEARELPSHRGHGGYFPPSNPPVSSPTSPSPLLRTDVEARELPSHRGHGGYFPPSNPPISSPTSLLPLLRTDVEAREVPSHRGHGGYFPPSNPPISSPTSAGMEADRVHADSATTLLTMRRRTPNSIWIEEDPPTVPSHHISYGVLWEPSLTGLTPLGKPTTTATTTTAHTHDPIISPVWTVSGPRPTASASTSLPTPHPSKTAPPCTATSIFYHHPSITSPLTVYNATVTRGFDVDCGGCDALTVQTMSFGRPPPVTVWRTTVTDPGTTTKYEPRCGPSYIL